MIRDHFRKTLNKNKASKRGEVRIAKDLLIDFGSSMYFMISKWQSGYFYLKT